MSDSQTPRLILELLGAAAGIAAFLTFVGGALMWIRFDELGLPAERAVALMPEPLLLTVGAQHLAVPAVAGLLAVVLIRVLPPLGNWTRGALGVTAAMVVSGYVGAVLWLETGYSVVGVVTLAVLTGLVVGVPLAMWIRRAERATLAVMLLVLGGGVVAAYKLAFELTLVPHLLIVAGVTVLSIAAIFATASSPAGFKPLAWVVFVAFLVSGTALVLARTDNAPKLEPVALLLEKPDEQIAGFLIGETDDRVHVARLAPATSSVAEVSAEPVESFVSVSRSRVERMALRRPSGLGLDDAGREQAQSLLEDLLAQQRVTRGERPPVVDPVATDDPASTFAPVLSLHPDEPVSPTSVDEFLRNSWLVWAHEGGCRDFSFALNAHARPDDRRRPGSASPRRLGNGGYAHRAGCDHGGTRFDTSDFTRPFAGEREGLRGAEGFYLDLRDGARTPKPRTTHQNEQLILQEVPVYFERHPEADGERITYWFFYPFSIPPGGGSSVAHEGDWERISVLVRPAGRGHFTPDSVRFHQHDTNVDVPWADVRKAPNENGLPTRPRAYVARGSHATYRRPGRFSQVLERAGRRIVTVHDEARSCPECPLWLTWQSLVDAEQAPWYGFGGAWGQVRRESSFTGPLGPSRHKTMNLSAAPERQLTQSQAMEAQVGRSARVPRQPGGARIAGRRARRLPREPVAPE